MKNSDMDGLIAWTAVANELIGDNIKGIEAVFASVPGGKRDLGLIRHLTQKHITTVIHGTIRDRSEGDRFMKILDQVHVYTGIKGMFGHPPMKPNRDFGMWVSYEDMNVLLKAVSEHCLMCDKSKAEVNACKLHRVLEKLPLMDGEDENLCAYQRRFTEEVLRGDK